VNGSMLQRFFAHVPLPERASSFAGNVDRLYFFLIFSTVGLAVLLAVLVITFAIRYRRRSKNEIPQQISGSNILEFGWTGASLGLFLIMFFWGAKRRAGNLRYGKAVDVEGSTPRRRARDQRTSCPGGPGRSHHHDLSGRHPQLLRARVPSEAGCCSGAIYITVVHAHQSRPLPPLLCRVLRCQTLRNGRLDRRTRAC
jgi:hypothetical protein